MSYVYHLCTCYIFPCCQNTKFLPPSLSAEVYSPVSHREASIQQEYTTTWITIGKFQSSLKFNKSKLKTRT